MKKALGEPPKSQCMKTDW